MLSHAKAARLLPLIGRVCPRFQRSGRSLYPIRLCPGEQHFEKVQCSFALNPSILEINLTTSEIALIDLISRMPGEIQKAAKELKPLTICNMAYELAKAFNDFYGPMSCTDCGGTSKESQGFDWWPLPNRRLQIVWRYWASQPHKRCEKRLVNQIIFKEMISMARIRTLIMGAAGRDFHNFNVFYRDNKEYEV